MSIGSPEYSLLVCLASLASGLLAGMLGMAAGIFIVPALTLLRENRPRAESARS